MREIEWLKGTQNYKYSINCGSQVGHFLHSECLLTYMLRSNIVTKELKLKSGVQKLP